MGPQRGVPAGDPGPGSPAMHGPAVQGQVEQGPAESGAGGLRTSKIININS